MKLAFSPRQICVSSYIFNSKWCLSSDESGGYRTRPTRNHQPVLALLHHLAVLVDQLGRQHHDAACRWLRGVCAELFMRGL